MVARWMPQKLIIPYAELVKPLTSCFHYIPKKNAHYC